MAHLKKTYPIKARDYLRAGEVSMQVQGLMKTIGFVPEVIRRVSICAYEAEMTQLQQNTPMTLAETASIMCETIATEAALEQTTDPQEVLAILEAQLNNASQVVVDRYSRYLFE